MDKSLKSLLRITRLLSKKDIIISNPLTRNKSVETSKKHLSLKNFFYQQENLKRNQKIMNKDLPILNLILVSTEKLHSIKTALTDTIPNNYNLEMINKYDEKKDSNLSFISQFDLEDNEQNINESFSSSNINNSCEEQINIETSNIKNFDDENEENNKKLEKEWYEIKDLLLNKEV